MDEFLPALLADMRDTTDDGTRADVLHDTLEALLARAAKRKVLFALCFGKGTYAGLQTLLNTFETTQPYEQPAPPTI